MDPNSGAWNGSEDVQVFIQPQGVTKTIDNPIPPSVTFDANGTGASFTPNSPTFDSWEHTGNSTFSGQTYTFGQVGTVDKLTAKYPLIFPAISKANNRCWWALTSKGSGNTVQPGQSVLITSAGSTTIGEDGQIISTGSKTIYAICYPNTYSFTININNGDSNLCSWGMTSYCYTVNKTSLSLRVGQSGTFTITPTSGYYLNGVSVPNGLTASGFVTGSTDTRARGTQTITVTNNGLTADDVHIYFQMGRL